MVRLFLWKDSGDKVKNYPLHPLCEIYPQMSDDDFAEFVADFETNKQTDPAIVYKGQLLDGKTRQRAAEQCGRKLIVTEWEPPTGCDDVEAEIAVFVQSKNSHRRHMTSSQRAMIAAAFSKYSKEGRPKKTVTEVTVKQGESAEKNAVSRKLVNEASSILNEGSKPLQSAVRDGKVTVTDASKIVDLPKSEQTKAVKAVAEGKAKTVTAAAKPKKGPCQINGQHEWEADGDGGRFCTHCKEDFKDDGPGEWKEFKRKLDKTYAAAMRAVDDLHEKKKNKAIHAKHIDALKELREELQKW